jgi:DNA-binding response OmpR family regulator
MSTVSHCTHCGAPQTEVEVEAPCPTCGSPPPAKARKNAYKATLLWIDDDLLLLGVCSESFEREGYRVLVASEGAAGIELARNEHPDLILVDVVMFEMDGLTVCERLRAEPGLADTPIVVLTVLDDASVRYRAREVGATTVLHKPFAFKDLVATVARLLEARSGTTKR